MIYSCKGCDHKYDYCHSVCPEYLKQKAEHDRMKEESDKKRYVRQAIYYQRDINVRRAIKKLKRKKKYGQ